MKHLAAVRLCLLIVCFTPFFGPEAGAQVSDRFTGEVKVHFVAAGETLLDIARANGLGILEVMAANPGIDPWIPRTGMPVVLPTFNLLPDVPRRGIVINLAEMRLFLFGAEGGLVASWPIGIGRLAFTTPLGETRIVRKQTDPTWYPNEQTRIDNPDLPAAVPPGPDNPMGRYALYLAWPEYAVHGTNRPWGVGRRVSRGCIRLYPEDIETLYGQVSVGTTVTVVDQAVKIGWHEGKLYLEIHPSRAQLDALEEGGAFSAEPVAGLVEQILAVIGEPSEAVDWSIVQRIERERRGIPIPITP